MKRFNRILSIFTLLFFLTVPFADAASSLFTYPKFHAQTSTGSALSGGKVYTYVAGTDTPKATYSNIGLTVENANPVVLNSSGDATIYLNGTYKIVLKNSAGVTQWTMDNVSGIESAWSGYEIDALNTYGAGSSYTQATIESALTAIGTSTKATLLLRQGTWVMSSNADYSTYTNVMFKLVPGAVISHGAYTLVLPNTPDAGRYQIFTGSGAITGVKYAYPEWFGAVGNGTTDDIAAFNLAKQCFPATQTGFRRGTIYLADNTGYYITTTLLLYNNIGMKGESWASEIKSGVTSGAAVEIQHTTWASETARRGGTYEDFRITYQDGTGAAGGLLVTSGGHLQFNRILVNGFTTDSQYGISFGAGPNVEFTANGLYSEGNWWGAYIPQSASLTTATFSSCSFRGNVRQGFFIVGNALFGLTLNNRTVIESNGASGFQFEAGTGSPINILLDGIYFEANNGTLAGKQIDIQGSASKYVYNVTIKDCTITTGGAAATGSFAYNYIRNLVMLNNHFPQAVAPNYDIWDLNGNIGQVWIGNDPNATVSGIVSPKSLLVEANFPVMQTRDNSYGDANLWGIDNIAVKSIATEAVGTFYSAVSALVGTLRCWAEAAQAWVELFVYWDGSTASYEAIATGTKAEVVSAAPTALNITSGKIGIGIYKDGSSLRIDVMNRNATTRKIGIDFRGTIP